MELARVDVTSSITLARDRHLPIAELFAPLLPEAGLVRGRIVGCTGPAATSLALALASRATLRGAWLAVVGMAPIGVEAARELGVAVDRLVAIDADHRQPGEWAARVIAAADGFEIILTEPPAGVGRVIRKVRQRVQAHGVVLLTVSATVEPEVGADVVLEATAGEWEGLGCGHGHLRRRRVVVRGSGRRMPRPVEREMWLPAGTGRAEPIQHAGQFETVETVETAVAAGAAGSLTLDRAG